MCVYVCVFVSVPRVSITSCVIWSDYLNYIIITLAIDKVDRHGLSNIAYHELQKKMTKLMPY